MNDATLLALKKLLYKMADDQLIIGHRNSEWTGLGPILEEDIAFSSMAQDKIGQSLHLYQLLQEFGESEPDIVAFSRNANQFHCCKFVELPIGEYDFSLIRHFLFDFAEAVRFEGLADSSFEPLAKMAAKFKGEIKYHTMHANIMVKSLAKNQGEAQDRLQRELNLGWNMALGIFESVENENLLISDKIFEGEESLKAKWLETVIPLLENAGLKVPDSSTWKPELGGLKGVHTVHLQPLLDEMTEVFAIDPGAEW